MKFIVGIGNPGKKYEKTRHNIGFKVLENLASKIDPKLEWKHSESKKAWIFKAKKNSVELVLIKPETYVNLSGVCLERVIEQGTLSSEILVVCDDVNLDFGKIRLRTAGSSGGHHGLESIIAVLQTQNFARLRFGVRSGIMPKDDLTDFVLGKFTSEEESRLKILIEKASSVCESWVYDGFESAVACLSRLQSNKDN